MQEEVVRQKLPDPSNLVLEYFSLTEYTVNLHYYFLMSHQE